MSLWDSYASLGGVGSRSREISAVLQCAQGRLTANMVGKYTEGFLSCGTVTGCTGGEKVEGRVQ